ncbi:class I SAM-dependent methyltransferase [Candidatus Micrarchaeota archaeon]|nr:class I SAM-dependent methyltransferase [Candidatus Micrarchaeota archaeon]
MKKYMNINGEYYEDAIKSGSSAQKFSYAARLANTLEQLSPKKGERILDIGFGSGVLLERIAALGADAFGADISEESVKYAKKKIPSAKLFVSGAEDLGCFQDYFFDKVVCTHLIEHLTAPEKCLREIHRVLKKGGVAVVETPNYLSIWPLGEFLFDKFMAKQNYSLRDQHISKLDYFSLIRLVKKTGFKVELAQTFYEFSLPASFVSTRLAYALFGLEKRVFGFPFGPFILLKLTK